MSASDSIIRAIEFALEKYSVNCDRTFISTIKKVNADGTYTILDEGGVERNVKCAIPLPKRLRVHTMVWVKMPCGNLNRLHICGVESKGDYLWQDQ